MSSLAIEFTLLNYSAGVRSPSCREKALCVVRCNRLQKLNINGRIGIFFLILNEPVVEIPTIIKERTMLCPTKLFDFPHGYLYCRNYTKPTQSSSCHARQARAVREMSIGIRQRWKWYQGRWLKGCSVNRRHRLY